MRRLAIWGVLAMTASAQQGWWMTEPIRWVQTNLRQTDAALDAGAPGGPAGRHARQRAADGHGRDRRLLSDQATEFHYREPGPSGRAATCSETCCARRMRERFA